MKCLLIALVIMVSSPFLSFSQAKQNLAVLPFTGIGVSTDDASIVTEILRAKLVTTNMYTILERKNLQQIIVEQELQQTAAIDPRTAIEIGKLAGAELLVSGSFMKMGSALVITVNMIDVKTGEIKASAEIKIPNIDSVYDKITALTTELVKEASGNNRFTFSTEPEGSSIELGINALLSRDGSGYGFSFGYTGGKGHAWLGFNTVWNFTNIDGYNGPKVINSLGALTGIIGNKVDSIAAILGIGAGYDFQLGLTINPQVGAYYKNVYCRYSPVLDITLTGANNIYNTYHQIEIGYSIFLGTKGKKATEFE